VKWHTEARHRRASGAITSVPYAGRLLLSLERKVNDNQDDKADKRDDLKSAHADILEWGQILIQKATRNVTPQTGAVICKFARAGVRFILTTA